MITGAEGALARRSLAPAHGVGSRLVVGIQKAAEKEFRPYLSLSLHLFSCFGELTQNACIVQGKCSTSAELGSEQTASRAWTGLQVG